MSSGAIVLISGLTNNTLLLILSIKEEATTNIEEAIIKYSKHNKFLMHSCQHQLNKKFF